MNMNAEGNAVVWILGAGFSRSLGGPLLYDLFSDRLFLGLRPWLEKNRVSQDWEFYNQIQHGFRGNTKKLDGKPWTNAEEFLEIVDHAQQDPNVRDILIQGLGNAAGLAKSLGEEDYSEAVAKQVYIATLRYLEYACSYWLPADFSLERTQPYVRWARLLQPNDTVVTFNYDEVAEKASEHAVSKPPHGPVYKLYKVSLNHQGGGMGEGPLLLKLHGCVAESHPDLQGCRYIVGPGGKQEVSKKLLWKEAKQRIKTARTIVFVGYRFPETDAVAKQTILDAIRENQNVARVSVVLGPPKQASSDIDRLTGMLEWANQNLLVVDEKMFAEDFLAVFDRNRLLE